MLQKHMPEKLSTAVKNTELTRIKATRKSASVADVKEEVPKHAVEEILESFLLTIRNTQTFADRNELMKELTEEEKKTNAINGVEIDLEAFSLSLTDNLLEMWEDEIGSIRSTQKNEAGFNCVMRELVDETCRPDAHDLQVEYTRNRSKPDSMDVSTWWRILEETSESLTCFEGESQLNSG